jgi:4-amino-4-deoxy-L-arabinose transferase-like glycosyltransferase
MTTQLTPSAGTAPADEAVRPARGRLRRLALGRPEDPRWARPALWGVLAVAAFLYCWDLSRNGDANTFYAAAVLSGTESWKAFFFGSLDSASFITVDKPPLAFWVMDLSARVFGFNSWSLLLPQAVEGVATVALLYSAVRRSVEGFTGARGAHAAGLLAALALTLTPMTVAIDRDDNPDTMLAFLMVLGGWLFLESLRAGLLRRSGTAVAGNRIRRVAGHPLFLLMMCALAWGLAFNTKMFEAFIPLPALAITYLIFANGRLRKRFGALLATGAVLAVVSFSWITVVDLIPATSRPFVGSSTNNTEWNLAIDYNGFGRVVGNTGFGGAGPTATAARGGAGFGDFPAGGAAAGGGAGTGGAGGHGGTLTAGRGGGAGGFGGQAGITRMFASTLGGQISWLIPFAIIAAIAALVLLWRRPRTDLARAAVLMWGGWFALEFGVLSFQQGTQHPYYTSAMAPSIAALVGIGAVALYQAYRRSSWLWTAVLAAAVAVTGGWAIVLLRRTPTWNAWLPWLIGAATAVVLVTLIAGQLRGHRVTGKLRGWLLAVGVAVGLVAVLAGPAAYAATPLAQPISGNNPLAGPSAGGGGFGGFGGGGFGGTFADGAASLRDRFGDGTRDGTGHGGYGGFGGGEYGTGGRQDTGTGTTGTRGTGTGGAGGAGTGGLGGFGGGGSVSKEMISYLQAHRDGATWLLAVSGSSTAASIILQTGGTPVMAMGGFTGSDPAPTLTQFQQYVSEGKVHYVLGGGAGGGFGGRGGGESDTAQVLAWVEKTCTAVPASDYGASSATGAEDLYYCK